MKIRTLLKEMSRVTFLLCFIGLVLITAPWHSSANAQSIKEIIGVKEGHCSMAQGTVDGRTFACMVWDNDPARFSGPTQIEIYRGRKLKYTIQSGSPIWEWHFWKEGKQLTVHYGSQHGAAFYVLYDSRNGAEVERMAGSPDSRRLPEWAKSQWVRAEESLPEGPAFLQQQSIWMGKVLEQISTIHAGMTRKELLTLFRGEGGISTRTHRTYVYKDCPYIKVDVVFSPAGRPDEFVQESDEDKLVGISGPYLAYGVMD